MKSRISKMPTAIRRLTAVTSFWFDVTLKTSSIATPATTDTTVKPTSGWRPRNGKSSALIAPPSSAFRMPT